MRGGGSLLHKILRQDPDLERLERIRKGFVNLYQNVDSSSLNSEVGFSDHHERVSSKSRISLNKGM